MPFIDPSLPLLDLHRHLDGAIRLTTILDLAQQHGVELPGATEEELKPHVVVQDPTAGLMDFIARFQYLTAVLCDAEACRRVAYENVEDAASEGIDYVELRFSPWFMAEPHGLDPAAVVEAVADGVEAASRDCGIGAQLIGIMSRTFDADTCHRELDALLRHRDRLVAIDLAGDEEQFPAALFVEHFRRVRDAGLAVTVHAGEVGGPENVWAAINDLGASRIGHGIRSLEDPALVDYLRENRIGLEVSLTSNLHIGAASEYARHPVVRMLEEELLVNLNTDDPAISGIDLPHEYRVAFEKVGLSETQLRQLQSNAVEMAFVSPSDRESLLRARAA